MGHHNGHQEAQICQYATIDFDRTSEEAVYDPPDWFFPSLTALGTTIIEQEIENIALAMFWGSINDFPVPVDVRQLAE